MKKVSDDERAFLEALARWAIHKWRPKKSFLGEFDEVVIAVEAVHGINPELADALDRMLPGKKRRRSGVTPGAHRAEAVQKLLHGLCKRGLIKGIKYSRHDQWYDIVEADDGSR